jgi:hypothetical protein
VVITAVVITVATIAAIVRHWNGRLGWWSWNRSKVGSSRLVIDGRAPSKRSVEIVLVFLIVTYCALLSAVLALALLREVRLRKTLESLLNRILSSWRKRHGKNNSDPATPCSFSVW